MTEPGLMSFRLPFRRYQQLALSWVESVLDTAEDDRRYHLVAPPGSGKTILGLELIGRFARPAVVLVPTTAIQEQWRDEVRLFIADDVPLDEVVSTDPARWAPVMVLTYQVLSTTSREDEPLDQLACERWCQELVDAEQAADSADAEQRLRELRKNNPRAYRRELGRRRRRVKKDLLRSGDAEIVRFLHSNAVKLLDRVVEAGVGTIVLDECHHLLDHWAVVVRYLMGRLDQPRVVGLTATLPDPDSPEEFENYDALLTDVDFQVPTPAVVKEGELAPYRDLVWFVDPTDREQAYLNDVQGAFEDALEEVTADPRFTDWLSDTVGVSDPQRWAQLLRDDPMFAIALMRVTHHLGLTVDEQLVVPVEAEQPPSGSDRAEVVARFGLRQLKVSPDPADHERLERLRRVLKPFGFVLTERGLRQSRSPGDLVLAYSEAKQHAATQILGREQVALGDQLRAVVVTDYERSGRGRARVGDALAADAGSARHTFETLAADPVLDELHPVLVTGASLWIDTSAADELVERFNRRISDLDADARCFVAEQDNHRHLAVIEGEGSDWASRLYVQLVTEAFEDGTTRCLVGTRGLLGEGWDALRLNTLIDLTSVTTAQSVQQLRGRSLRLDPAWPHKVAHNWDVVCLATDFDRGDRDLRRFVARHEQFWGVVPITRVQQVAADVLDGVGQMLSGENDSISLSPRLRGQVVRGVAHVDLDLNWQLLTKPWRRIDYDKPTRNSIRAIGDRRSSYEQWEVGQPYENTHRWVTRLDHSGFEIRTAHTITDTLRHLIRAFRASLYAGLALTLYVVLRFGLGAGQNLASTHTLAALGWTLLAGLTLTLAFNAKTAGKILKRLVEGQHPEAIAEDLGRAILVGLRNADLVSEFLIPEHVRVAEQPDGTIELLLEHAPEADAKTFVRAVGQALGPINDPRYLILRDDRRLPDVGLRWLWVPLRTALGGARSHYHAVPDDLAVNRERAEAFANAWSKYVGGGQLIYTRSDEGWRTLLEARARTAPTATAWAFERWQ